jgi:WD40 repeat protein
VNGAVELRDGRILSWSDDHTLRLWGADGAPIAALTGHTAWVNGAVELRDGRILSWSDDNTLRLWGADGAAIAVLEQDYRVGDRHIIAQWAHEHGLTLDDVYPPDSQTDPIMAGGRVEKAGSDIIIYHPQTGKRITTFYGDAELTTDVAVTAGGHVLAVGDSAGRVVFLRWVGL